MASNGNKGKFSERIKKIAFRKKNRMIYEEDENTKIRYQNVLKVLAAVPGMVYSNLYIEDDKNKVNNIKKRKEISRKNLINEIDIDEIKKKQDIFFKKDSKLDLVVNKRAELKEIDNEHMTSMKQEEDINIKVNDNKQEVSVEKISDTLDKQKVPVEKINEQENIINNNILEDNTSKFNAMSSFQDDQGEDKKKVEKLEKDILDIIKKKLVLSINTLEILQSDLYILSEVNGDAKTKEECEKQIKEIKELLKRIEKLKEQYDFLKDNYDFEYLMALDDDNLIDKIIELKDVFDKNQVRAFVKDYKLLEEYKYLYLKIDKLQEKTNELEEEKDKELEKLKERDIDFEKLKNKIYNANGINDMYNNMINDQNEILKELDKNISKINSYFQVDYHIKGLNKLLFNAFKYFGLLMMSPLRGMFPSIAIQTLMTRDMLKGVYQKVHWEETKKTVYEAADYSSSISQVIDNMDYISNSIDDNLDKLIKLKEIYNKRFKKYQTDNIEYKKVIDMINDMENKMLGNKIKVEIMKKKALEQKKANDKKLVLVNKLNEEQNK